MLSISNARSSEKFTDVDDRILRATETCVRDFGFDRVTVAEVARRARVSRPTIYRRWPDVHALLGAMFIRRVILILRDAPGGPPEREAIVARSVAAVAALRHDVLVNAVLRSAPELGLRHVAERLGAGQLALIELLARDLTTAQAGGGVRPGDTRKMAAMMMLIAQSAVQSAAALSPVLDESVLDAELSELMNRYLR